MEDMYTDVKQQRVENMIVLPVSLKDLRGSCKQCLQHRQLSLSMACKHLINKDSSIHHQKISPCVNAHSLKYEVCGKFKTQKMHIARVADGLAQGNCSFLSASYRLTAAK